jgi:hypothetical protein
MGLDVALGLVVLSAAIRGWIKGFVSQAVRLIGLVACFYLANPVREQARPYVLARLPKIDPALMDRILWWVAAVVSYVVLVGLITLTIQIMRTPPPPGLTRSPRNDQFAGLFLGAGKGALVAAFLAAGYEKYAADIVKHLPWAGPQANGSHALEWTQKYQPVPKIWSAPPVRRLVEHIQRNGLRGRTRAEAEADPAEPDQVAEGTSVSPSSRLPRLDLPSGDFDPADLAPEVAKELEDLKAELQTRRQPPE